MRVLTHVIDNMTRSLTHDCNTCRKPWKTRCLSASKRLRSDRRRVSRNASSRAIDVIMTSLIVSRCEHDSPFARSMRARKICDRNSNHRFIFFLKTSFKTRRHSRIARCAKPLMLLLHHVACGALRPYSSIGTRRVHLIAVALIASLALRARHSPHRTVCDESRAARNIDSLNAAFAAHRDKLSREVANRCLASA